MKNQKYEKYSSMEKSTVKAIMQGEEIELLNDTDNEEWDVIYDHKPATVKQYRHSHTTPISALILSNKKLVSCHIIFLSTKPHQQPEVIILVGF